MKAFACIAMILLAGRTAGAQVVIHEPLEPMCGGDGLDVTGTYAQCALWIDDGTLKRGMPGVVLEHHTMWSALQLGRFVIGDSARHYAEEYAWGSKWGDKISKTGWDIVTGGFLYQLFKHCSSVTCPDQRRSLIRKFYTVGGSLLVVGFPFHIHAGNASTLALFWSNSTLTR
jgi:hypothetical protein